ncbi:MAG: hypothetical protein K6F71_13780 [Ruminococcus sp.]|uniref:DUF7660 family protein n=1 Tax=Ruminococcus sp. TaxID=41978 RepID=UPI0025D30774|nr:hypothetical protein [Ruminococcus sp.]MCR5541872.1 hypothetical protein [Ruminococcus sp.]
MAGYSEMLGSIKTREDFLRFMELFMADIEDEGVRDYLGSLTAWAHDMDGYYSNTGKEKPKDINWDFIATLLYTGSIYE